MTLVVNWKFADPIIQTLTTSGKTNVMKTKQTDETMVYLDSTDVTVHVPFLKTHTYDC